MYCPRCGDELSLTQRGLECRRGVMQLSQILQKRFEECFVARTDRPREFTANFRVGGRWFCPECGAACTETDGAVRCLACGHNLNEFIRSLVELHVHQ